MLWSMLYIQKMEVGNGKVDSWKKSQSRKDSQWRQNNWIFAVFAVPIEDLNSEVSLASLNHWEVPLILLTERCHWHCTESKSKVPLTLLSQNLRCPRHCRVKTRGATDKAESKTGGASDAVESTPKMLMTLLSQNQRCHWHRRVKIRGANDITESKPEVPLTS